MATCESNGHLWGVNNCCIFCAESRPNIKVERLANKFYTREVYEAAQVYRHCPLTDPTMVSDAYHRLLEAIAKVALEVIE